ncbi:hypothetical protein EDC01DRAFT_643926 [Geopyxis carbonaria]|nr:hypothetical protein EDC01DRAFT_643926 [Geopyxis carbonaria]
MARLRSAVNKAKETGASIAANISESSSKLIQSAKPAGRKNDEDDASATLNKTQSVRKSRMPVPKTPTKPITYPSLAKFEFETTATALEIELPHSLARTPTTSSIPSPKRTKSVKTLAPPVISEECTNLMPGSFSPPKSSTFDFKFSTGLGERGKKILDDLKESAAAIRAQMPTTPKSKTMVTGAATTGQHKRFQDIHEKQFSRMDSIANHYAAKRTPVKFGDAPPQTPQKSVKRSQLQAKLDDKPLPIIPSPSPQKKSAEIGPEMMDGSRMKRAKIEKVPSPPTSQINVFQRGSMGRRQISKTASRIGAAVTASERRRVSGTKKPLPALPKAMKPSVRLVPESPAGTMTSRIPVTPSRFENKPNFAPATVAAPKFHLPDIPRELTMPDVPRHEPGASLPKKVTLSLSPKKSTTIGNFTFKAKAAGHSSFKRLSEIHSHAMSSAAQRMPGAGKNTVMSPGFTESSAIDDPFGGTERRTAREWGMQSPSKIASKFLAAATPRRKRKELDSDESEEEDIKGTVATPLKQQTGPPRKRQKFDDAIAKNKEIAKDAIARGKNAIKSRLDALATPKRRTERVRKNAAPQSARALRKPTWR